jgi:hypothetical protein
MGKAKTAFALTSKRSNDATKSSSIADDQHGCSVVSFDKQAAAKIVKDQGQPSLFCSGGGTQAYTIFEHPESLHCFLKAQESRCEGSDDPQEHMMFYSAKMKNNRNQAKDHALAHHGQIVGWPEKSLPEHAKTFFYRDARTLQFPLVRKGVTASK